MKNDIVELTDREHILKRPAMYIGAVDATESEEYILENNKVELKTVKFVPALVKIINEIIDNSVDAAIKSNFKDCNKIIVKITDDTVEVSDNGTGIPVKLSGTKWMPEIAWGRMRSGSNFSDDQNRTQIGMNGVGSFCTNCFSTVFKGISDDGIKRCECLFTDNASKVVTKVSETKSRGVTVKFKPDLKRFSLASIDETHQAIIKQRLMNLKMSFPDIEFKFNGKNIIINSFKKFTQMFDANPEILETDNWSIAIFHNEHDDFRQFSYVNGLKIPDGGSHIDYIASNVVQRVRDKLVKKYKTIKPGDIKNKIFVLAFLKNLKNAKFNSQSKEKITNSQGEISKYFGEIDWDSFTKRILKNSAIIDPICEVYKIKEELKRRQEMKSLSKPKKIRNEKYLAPIGSQKYLMIVEGECLAEDTSVLRSNYTSATIKDLNPGDYVLSKDFKEVPILAKTKGVRKIFKIKTKTATVRAGIKHRFFVYSVKDKDFMYKTVEDLKEDPKNYKIVRSLLNSSTKTNEVLENNIADFKLKTKNGIISYTPDDKFFVISDGTILKLNGFEIQKGDCILYFLDF